MGRISSSAIVIAALALTGCSSKETAATGNEARAPDEAPAATATPPAAGTTAVPVEARSISVNVQGAAPVGVTVRVKNVELGTDATMLDVSASYGGTTTNDVSLAGSATYLLDEQGNRLMLKPPQDNPSLRVIKGQTMEGRLVFLGAVPAGAKSVKLVFNDNNDGNSIIDPGLTITLPLDAGGQ